MTAVDTCRAALASLPPAISGAGGHQVTFHAACQCVRLGLPDGVALALLHEYNRRCQPAWTEKELEHKLIDARRAVACRTAPPSGRPPPVRLTWTLQGKPAPQPEAGEQPSETRQAEPVRVAAPAATPSRGRALIAGVLCWPINHEPRRKRKDFWPDGMATVTALPEAMTDLPEALRRFLYG